MTDRLEELSARARRERLREEEARELTAELAQSEEARLWHHAGRAFDAEDVVLPGDAAATERVLSRLIRELPRKKPQWRARAALLLIAAAALVASVAAAAVLELGARKHAPKSPSAASGTPSAPSAIKAHAPPSVSTAPTTEEPPAADAEPAPSASAPPSASASASVEAPASSAAPTLPPTASAAELMSAAGRARRHGDSSQAIELLNQLEAHYPNSPEARASEVSLGMILLKIGSIASARSHFERYLARSPQGSLAPDALWGKSEAQLAQHDRNGAQRTLHDLLAQFPTCAYASAAQAKLDDQ